MKRNKPITREILKELFDYCESGNLINKLDRHLVAAGSIQKTHKSAKGYLCLDLFDRTECLHRLIYTWHHGDPPEIVDHIDRDRLNNKIDNLRAATASESVVNSCKSNRLGLRGVQSGHRAQIQMNKRHVYLGAQSTDEYAAKVYDAAAHLLHGKFAVTNFEGVDLGALEEANYWILRAGVT